MVSSMTPRLDPRWPPVRATASTRNWRISAASTGSFPASNALRSAGDLIDASNDTWSSLRLEPRHPPLAAKRPLDEIGRVAGAAQPVPFGLVGGDRLLRRLRRGVPAQLDAHGAKTVVGGREG